MSRLAKAQEQKDEIERHIAQLPKLEEQVRQFKEQGLEEKLKQVPLLEKERQLGPEDSGGSKAHPRWSAATPGVAARFGFPQRQGARRIATRRIATGAGDSSWTTSVRLCARSSGRSTRPSARQRRRSPGLSPNSPKRWQPPRLSSRRSSPSCRRWQARMARRSGAPISDCYARLNRFARHRRA